MKEISWSRFRRGAVIFGCFVLTFILATCIGYFAEVRWLNDLEYTYNDYLLYLLGYGDLENVNAVFKLVFSISSLTILTLLSSACTVTWLESKRNLVLDDHIVISKSDDNMFLAGLQLKSRKRDVFGAKVFAIVNVNGKAYSESTEIAYIPKNKCATAIFEINLNSVIYKHFRESYNKKSDVTELVITVTYSDIISGTEYTVCEKFSCTETSNFIFCDNQTATTSSNSIETEFNKFISQQKFDVDFEEAVRIDSKLPDRIKVGRAERFDVNFNTSVNYTDGDFQMLFVPIPEVSNWGVYHDMKCTFQIELLIADDIDITVEIKKSNGSILPLHCDNKVTQNASVLTVKLEDYRRDTWEDIRELCLTVFKRDVRTENKEAQFFVKECGFILP